MQRMHALLLNVLVSAVAALSFAALSGGQGVRFRHVNFNLATEPYESLYKRLETTLKEPSTPPYNPRDIDGRYVMGPRRQGFKGRPRGWIMVHLTAGPEPPGPANTATLALADDDLCMLGFANGSDHWHFVEGFSSGIRGATALPFGANYGEIIGGGHRNFWRVLLGRDSAVLGATTMARYDPDGTPTSDIKGAFVRSVVMYCEAIRFTPIRMVFGGDRWEHRTYISRAQAKWVAFWGRCPRCSSPRPWARSDRQEWGAPPRFSDIARIVRDEIEVATPAQAFAQT